MATNNSLSLAPDITTEGNFRAFARTIGAQIAAMGLVKSNDTGQINLDVAETRALTQNNSFPVVNAFDANAALVYQSSAAPTIATPQWILFDAGLGNTFTPGSYAIYTSNIAADPKDVILQHSSDATTWTDFDTRALILSVGYQQWNLSGAPARRYWRLSVTSTQSNSAFLQISEFQLWTGAGLTGFRAVGTSVRPVAANTAAGFEIFKMAGTFSVSAPVYLKVEYGGGSSPNYPGLWLTLGTQTDGAGTLTGLLTSERRQLSCAVNATAPGKSAIAGDVNRLAMLLFYNSGSILFFAVERSRDASGAETSDGAVLLGNSGAQKFQLYLPFVGAPPPTETDFGCMVPTLGTGARANAVSLYGIKPFAPEEKPPMLGAMAYFVTDLTAEVPVPGVKLFGQAADRTIFPTGVLTIGRGNASARLALLWE